MLMELPKDFNPSKYKELNDDLSKLNDSQLDDSLKDSLNNVDPWLQKKLSSE